MKLLDIVNQLRVVLPKHTDKFSTLINTLSATVSNNTLTIITDGEHKLKSGNIITLSNYITKTYITDVSKSGFQYTFTTNTDHDLTENWQDEITLGGFDSAAWNTTFELSRVPNRKTFVVTSINDIPLLNAGEFLYENRIDGINGRYAITLVDPTSFTITDEFLNGSYIGGVINSNVRVVGSISLERFMEQYTEQNTNDLWICVVMEDADVSKDRNTYSDAIATPVTGSEIRLLLVDEFSIYIVGNVSDESAAQQMIDICRHDLLLPILKSVYGVRFITGLVNETDFRTTFKGHGTSFYDKSKYVHVYNFEMSMELTNDETVDRMDTRAYRDTNQTINIIGNDDIGEDYATITIDHDDEPLTS